MSNTNTTSIHDVTYSRSITTDWKPAPSYGKGCKMRVFMRYDDGCHNGHNTFAITGEVVNSRGRWEAGGCLHDDIRKLFPEYAHLIQWHLTSSDGPLHYIANTLYHATDHRIKAQASVEEAVRALDAYKQEHGHKPCGEYAETWGEDTRRLLAAFHRAMGARDIAKGPNIEAARSSAIAPDATLEQLQDAAWLEARLPDLMDEFRAVMESIDWS